MTSARLAVVGAALVVVGTPVVQQAALPPGVVRAGEYRVAPPAVPAASVAGTVYDVGPFPLSTPDLPAGEGREATVAMCSVCHSVRYITMQPALPAETWRATVRKMVDVHGAPIPDDLAERVTSYLQRYFSSAKTSSLTAPPDRHLSLNAESPSALRAAWAAASRWRISSGFQGVVQRRDDRDLSQESLGA